MKLIFLGTRGNIKITSALHARHASCLIMHRNKRLMIDCGLDWLNLLPIIKPDAIILTHAHPDHAAGLRKGSSCSVYATQETWQLIKSYPIDHKHIVIPRQPFVCNGITIEAFSVEHSLRAPAVGYKITVGKSAIFYVPDLVYIYEQAEALSDINLYIGDGARLTHSLLRKRDSSLIGHTSIKTQLTWCSQEQVPRAIFTHCGTQIVRTDPAIINQTLKKLSDESGIPAIIAFDGMRIEM